MEQFSALDHAFVVPAYGVSPYLSRCLESIAAQTYSGSAVLITTSTPSDGLDAIAASHGLTVRVNGHRGGIGSDWNCALTATDARYVTLAHQDDAYRPQYLERVLAAITPVPDALIGFCDFDEVTDAGPRPLHVNLRLKRLLCERAFRGRHSIRDARDKRRLLAWGNPIGCPGVVFDRRNVPDFRFVEDMASNLDWEAWLRLAECSGAFVRVAEPLVTRRIHEESETSALIADRRRIVEDRAMFARMWPRPIAELIAAVYRSSYRANRTPRSAFSAPDDARDINRAA
ncbi:MAG TPA: glycosyltransferase [Casimicrobiaceae bacterium]|nr:glycosyltransferase [Casimicrobiaceae bacterium]